MHEQLQAIITVLSLINPAICAAMFARAVAGRSLGEKMTDAAKAGAAVLVILTLAALLGMQLLHLFGVSLDRRPHAAFGNSTGDRQMLEYTKTGDGAQLSMIVLHDDAQREYAYGPAQGLPNTKVGAFSQALDDEAKKDGWVVISMKNDWKRIFTFD
jgi:hypothetical protein